MNENVVEMPQSKTARVKIRLTNTAKVVGAAILAAGLIAVVVKKASASDTTPETE